MNASDTGVRHAAAGLDMTDGLRMVLPRELFSDP
jgi:hypothetical protein